MGNKNYKVYYLKTSKIILTFLIERWIVIAYVEVQYFLNKRREWVFNDIVQTREDLSYAKILKVMNYDA